MVVLLLQRKRQKAQWITYQPFESIMILAVSTVSQSKLPCVCYVADLTDFFRSIKILISITALGGGEFHVSMGVTGFKS